MRTPSNPMPVSVTAPAPRPAWEQLVGLDPLALPSHTPLWMDAMCSWGFADCSRFYAGPDGQRAVVPLARRRLVPDAIGRVAGMPPGWGFGGAVTDSADDVFFLEAVAADLSRLRGVQTVLRPNPLRAAAWDKAVPADVVRVRGRVHILDISAGFDEWWERTVSKGFRKKVRRAERMGVEVRCGTGGELLDEFRDLFLMSIRRFADALHEPQWLALARAHVRDPAAKYERLAAHLGDAFRVYIAYHDGAPVAGDIVLLGRNAHNTRGAMNKELAAPLRATLLVQYHAIRDACAAGADSYNLGETGWSSSLSEFKEHLGAEAYEYDQYRFERLPITTVDRAVRDVVRAGLGVRHAS